MLRVSWLETVVFKEEKKTKPNCPKYILKANNICIHWVNTISQSPTSSIWAVSLTNINLPPPFIISRSLNAKLEHSVRVTLKIATWWIGKGKSL